MTRRAWLGALAAGAGGALAACAQGAPDGAEPAKVEQKTTIEWWTNWGTGGLSAEVFNSVATAANAVGRTFQVQHTPQSDGAKKLAAVQAAGAPPSVSTGNLPYPELWSQGMAEPIDDLLKKSRQLRRDDLFPESWAYGSYKGKTYGVPAVESFVRWGLVINEALVQKHGLDPAKPPTTWDELLAWHRELTVVDPASKAISQLGVDPKGSMANGTGGGDPFLWGPAWGINFYDPAREQFDLTNPKLEEALVTMQRFFEVVGGYEARQEFRKQFGNWTGNRSGIVVGTEAMQINGYWTPGSLTKLVPSNRYAYSWVPVAAARKGKKIQATGGHFAVLPKGAPHLEPAFEFLEFLTGEQAGTIIFDGTGWLGARKSFLNKLDAGRYPGLDFFLRSATAADEVWEAAVNPIEGFFGTEWNKNVEAVLLGQVSPKVALQEAQRSCTEELRRRLGR